MKKFLKSVLFVLIILTIASCASMPFDRGYFGDVDETASDYATLTIHDDVKVKMIDKTDTNWKNQGEFNRSQIVRLTPGVHTFSVTYNNGRVYTLFNTTVIANLEKNRDYIIEGIIDGNKVRYEVTSTDDNASAILDMNKLQGNAPGVISQYIKYVLNPTMEGTDKTVKLENDEWLFYYKPDMIFTGTEKDSGREIIGRRGFVTDFTMKEGTTFLLECDIDAVSREQFLNESDYQNTAQIVVVPVACDGRTVTYRYVKPEEMAETEITFTISVLD